MKKIFKQFIYTVTSAFLMLTPVTAGQCELQTEVSVYQVAAGQTLTEEEQRAVHATIDYFIANPNVEFVRINSNDFPSISTQKFDFINNLNNKLDVITEKYRQNCFDGTYVKQDYLVSAYSLTISGDYVEMIIKNCYSRNLLDSDKTVTAKQLKDWVDYTYNLVPDLGVVNGMDEREAIDIINNFVCDYITYEKNNAYDFTNIYENQRGVCSDYSALFKALANGSGIECYEIYSDTHAWNQVTIDGQMLEIDSCWNDTDLESRHDYYLISREQMRQAEFHENIKEVF